MSEKQKEISVFCSISNPHLKGIERVLIPSLARQKNIAVINLYLLNYEGKGLIYKGVKKMGNVRIEEVANDKPRGFGEAHNYLFEKVKPITPFLIINPDAYLHEKCLYYLSKRFEEEKNPGLIEARQLPYVHPKEYDKKTGETPWAAGTCLLINPITFKKIGGFDPAFWMYTEDVDLSWRTWLSGYRVIHEPQAVVYHYTGVYFEYNSDRYYLEHFWTARNFLYIAYKFWGSKGEKMAKRLLMSTSYPKNFRKEVVADFEDMKAGLSKDKINLLAQAKNAKYKKKLKILEFNQFHKMTNV